MNGNGEGGSNEDRRLQGVRWHCSIAPGVAAIAVAVIAIAPEVVTTAVAVIAIAPGVVTTAVAVIAIASGVVETAVAVAAIASGVVTTAVAVAAIASGVVATALTLVATALPIVSMPFTRVAAMREVAAVTLSCRASRRPSLRGPAIGCYDPLVRSPAILLASAIAVAAGCAGRTGAVRGPSVPLGLRESNLRAPEDPTVRGARLLPERMDEAHAWGTEPGGGVRWIVAGERVLTWPEGSLSATTDRLPATPSSVLEVPERMGGGFLFAMGARIWRSDAWLGPARPVLDAPGAVAQVLLGLDRVYARVPSGGLLAFDPRTGQLVGPGPLPASPSLLNVAALDGWRAVAIADLRGALVTLDAGATWRPLALPMDAADLVLVEGAIAIGGMDEARQAQWWEVRPDGHVGRLSAAPHAAEEVDTTPPPLDVAARAFGDHPLVAAIEDGWPLTDETAVVARDGALGRVRLSDGALVESVADAFPLKPSRCHPLAMPRKGDEGAFGFVCGEPRGRTIVYRWSAPEGRMVELRRFDGPREVLAFGNGALAVRGPCSEEPASDAAPDDQAFCLMPPGGPWNEMHFRGDDVDRARLVVLSDGRVALVRPPRGGDLSTARLTITDGAKSTHLPVVLPRLKADAAHALRVGMWLDGFEERRPGVLGGWVDAAGSVLGVEISLDGQASVGSYIRAAGEVFTSGRWGLSWTASRRGMETIDGGMTWKDLEMPEPIAPARATRARACGPIGCLAAGWMRVGWGEPPKATVKEPPGRTRHPTVTPPPLVLDCEPTSGKPPEPKALPVALRPALRPAPMPPPPRWGMAMSPQWPGSAELPPFSVRRAPVLSPDDLGVSVEGTVTADRQRGVPVVRAYAWGPKSGDWDQAGRWEIRWQWPFGGWPEIRSSATAQAPWASLDAARRWMGIGAVPTTWALAPGDDADHALLLGKRSTAPPTTDVLVLESDRAPVEVRRPGGDPFLDVDAAVRVAGRWYVATPQAPGERAATVVWLVDGTGGREIARVPRTGPEPRPQLRLARRSDGRAVGLVVDGPTEGAAGSMIRWVVSVDLESGSVGDPEPLAPADLADRALTLCSGEEPGWDVDLPLMGAVHVQIAPRWSSGVQSPLARVRLSREHACALRLLGTVDAYAATAPDALARPVFPAATRRGDVRAIDASVLSARTRYGLRCWLRPEPRP